MRGHQLGHCHRHEGERNECPREREKLSNSGSNLEVEKARFAHRSDEKMGGKKRVENDYDGFGLRK